MYWSAQELYASWSYELSNCLSTYALLQLIRHLLVQHWTEQWRNVETGEYRHTIPESKKCV